MIRLLHLGVVLGKRFEILVMSTQMILVSIQIGVEVFIIWLCQVIKYTI